MKNIKNVVKSLLIGAITVIGIVVGGQSSEAKEITNVNINNDVKTIEYNDNSYDVIYDNSNSEYYNYNAVESFDADNNYNTKEFYIVDTYMRNSKQITLYNDDSFAIIDRDNNIYSFYSDKLGDWNYSCNSVDELNKLILSYKDHFNDNVATTLSVVNSYTKDNGSIVTEYNDYSYSVVNVTNNLYEFYPALTDDYSIYCNNENELNNCIATYKSILENGWY